MSTSTVSVVIPAYPRYGMHLWTFALEATARGGTLVEVSTPAAIIEKPRSIAWEHVRQFGHVLRWLWAA
ncbi:hypothetical protein [Halodesulfurarchaeum sp.]|uniref:hypothetical protein n=1 Tax=Halodesulfurarchaeum sp. TaxID=1980530 RepID=UPI001BBDE215|nr:hypothetical protein [Halodesulfurarchaeum sp.]